MDGLFPILFDDELPDRDSGDPEVVVEFVRRSMAAAPADYYMLVLSGHGGGIMGDFLTDSAAGAKPAGSLTIPAVGQIFRGCAPSRGKAPPASAHRQSMSSVSIPA